MRVLGGAGEGVEVAGGAGVQGQSPPTDTNRT